MFLDQWCEAYDSAIVHVTYIDYKILSMMQMGHLHGSFTMFTSLPNACTSFT